MNTKYVRLEYVIAIITVLILGFLVWHRHFMIKQGFFPPAPPNVPANFDPMAENAIPLDSFEIPYELWPAGEDGLAILKSYWFGFELKFPEELIVQKMGLRRNELMLYFIGDQNVSGYQDEEELQVVMEVTNFKEAADLHKAMASKEWRIDVGDYGSIVYRGQYGEGENLSLPAIATVFERDGFYYILSVASDGDADARERLFNIVARDFRLIQAQMLEEVNNL